MPEDQKHKKTHTAAAKLSAKREGGLLPGEHLKQLVKQNQAPATSW